jgi:hypothetical protein
MKDRFDLENDIMNVWAIKDQVGTMMWRFYDHPELLSEDEQMNHIMAIQYAIELNCAKLMDTYCQVFQLNEYASAEVKEMRTNMLRDLEAKADKEDLPSFPIKSKKAKKQGNK